MEVLWLGSSQQLQCLDIAEIDILSSQVKISDTARDLGIIVDSQLAMSAHVSTVCKSGFKFNQLWQLCPLIQSLSTSATKMLAQAFVSLHLDYWNSLLYHRPTNATGAVCTERGCTSGDWCSSKRPHHTSVVSAALATCAAARRLQGHLAGFPVFDWPSPGLPCWTSAAWC